LIPFIGKKSHHPQRQHFSAPTTTAMPARITLFNAQTTTLVATAQSCIHLKERKNLQKKKKTDEFLCWAATTDERTGGGSYTLGWWPHQSTALEKGVAPNTGPTA